MELSWHIRWCRLCPEHVYYWSIIGSGRWRGVDARAGKAQRRNRSPCVLLGDQSLSQGCQARRSYPLSQSACKPLLWGRSAGLLARVLSLQPLEGCGQTGKQHNAADTISTWPEVTCFKFLFFCVPCVYLKLIGNARSTFFEGELNS